MQFAEYFDSDALKPYLYQLSKKLSEGHICLDISSITKDELVDNPYGNAYPDIKNQDFDGLLTNLSDTDSMSPATKTPFIRLGHLFYIQRYFHYETMILQRIVSFIKKEKELRPALKRAVEANKESLLNLFNNKQPQNNNNQSVNWQLISVISALTQQFTIITGGPGTGKTTTVSKILAMLFTMQPDLKVALCAPTGKAAARMAESLQQAGKQYSSGLQLKFTELEPSTIHRLLGPQRNSPYFRHNAADPLPFDLIIVDESSMIDAALFAKLFDAIGPDSRIILLGDKDQLASVEAGSLFGDICGTLLNISKLDINSNDQNFSFNQFSAATVTWINSLLPEGETVLSSQHTSEVNDHLLIEHIIELSHSHRFSDDRGIGKFSKAIIQNQPKTILSFFEGKDEQVQLDTDYSNALFESFVKGYESYINEPDIAIALNKLHHLRVLCAVREGEQGLYVVNKRIERYLVRKGWIQTVEEFYINRPIMVTSNNPALQLFNGDIGIIRPDQAGILKAWFDNGDESVRPVTPGYITQLETVFAMTIHKSQGSEFNAVMLILPKAEKMQLLTRELVYTGITRAKTKVILQASKELLLLAASTFIDRGSGIAERMALMPLP